MLSTHHPCIGTSALQERLRENLGQHDQEQPAAEATPVDLTFQEPELERD